jgi:hypothetical protein
MTPYCAFPNTQSAATAVHRFHKDAYVDVTLTARPYNRFEPLNTTWWLIPSTEWPAYHRGKLYFYRRFSEDGETALSVGLVAEKGFGPVLATIDPKTRPGIIGTGWLWPELVGDLSCGAMDAAAAQVAEQTGLPVSVSVDASYYQDMDPGDPYAQRDQNDQLVFETAGTDLKLVKQKLVVNLLRHLVECQTLADLGRGLQSTPDQDWSWIDLGFGVAFKMVPLQSSTDLPPDAWDEVMLWDRALVTWLPWVR